MLSPGAADHGGSLAETSLARALVAAAQLRAVRKGPGRVRVGVCSVPVASIQIRLSLLFQASSASPGRVSSVVGLQGGGVVAGDLLEPGKHLVCHVELLERGGP